MTTIAIIGCGIGGATAALALHRRAYEVRVFERAPTLSEVGAGVGLLPNAMRVLDELGLGDKVRSRGQIFRAAMLGTPRGQILHTMDLNQIAGPDAPLGCVIHRAQLLSIILADIPREIVATSAECVAIDQDPDGAHIHFKNGASAKADLVVGADGIHSMVRRCLLGDTPLRYSGQTCFRGIARYQLDNRDVIREIQGGGVRASAMHVDNERVYWWAAINAKQGERLSAEHRRDRLQKCFADWPFGIPESIAATPAENILQNDLVDRRPLRAWSKGRITLLGDAAHPMVPNLGQGACSSIEDALVLANSLSKHPGNFQAALAAYERERVARTSMLTRLSWLYGMPCVWQNKYAVAVRNTLTKLFPQAFITQTFRKILAYDATR